MPWNNTIIIFSIWWANLAIMLDYWIFPISIYYLSNHDKQIHLDNFCLPKILPGCNLKWKYDHCIKTGNNLSTFPDLWLTSSLVVGLKEKKSTIIFVRVTDIYKRWLHTTEPVASILRTLNELFKYYWANYTPLAFINQQIIDTYFAYAFDVFRLVLD